MPSEDKYMTVEEVAAYLGFEKQTIYNKVHTNAIPFHKIGLKAVRFKKAEVDAWIERQKTSAREYVKKGGRYLLKIEDALRDYDITSEKEFLAVFLRETKSYWTGERLPFEFNKEDMRIVKEILKNGLVFPRVIKSGVPIYEGCDDSTLTSYLTLYKVLKDKFSPLFKDGADLDFFKLLKGRLIENVKEHFALPDPDTAEDQGEAFIGFRVNDLADDFLHEFRRIVVYLEYGKKEPKSSLIAYANRYFNAETFVALYVEKFCYFAQNPFSDYGHFYLKDKPVDQLTPSQIELGLKHDLFSFDEIKAALTARIADLGAETAALKSIVKQSTKGGVRGRKD